MPYVSSDGTEISVKVKEIMTSSKNYSVLIQNVLKDKEEIIFVSIDVSPNHENEI